MAFLELIWIAWSQSAIARSSSFFSQQRLARETKASSFAGSSRIASLKSVSAFWNSCFLCQEAPRQTKTSERLDRA